VTDVTGSAAAGKIRAAAAITRDEIEELFGAHIHAETDLDYDAAAMAVRARRRRTLGALVLADGTAPVENLDAAARLLAEVAVAHLPWSQGQLALRSRAEFLRQTVGEPWPDVSDVVLTPERLLPHLQGHTSLRELTANDLEGLLNELLPYGVRAEIDRALPSYFEAPTGSRIAIDYGATGGPAIELRVQELYGLDRHPSIASGRIPLTLVLLSPAHRPIQTTRDLPGFWRGSWKDVAKDMRGRYPRHLWPDDPASATPTTRAKPRGT
jgi:ATP-dependent helicase HrpB